MNQLTTVRALQQRITEMQPVQLGESALPTASALRPLLPGGALRKGAFTTVQGSLQLALALLSEASAQGSWCGAIGVADLGVEAAARLHLTLDRFVVVPNPGRHALTIAGMLSEVVTVLILQPERRPASGEVERLHARLRDHGTSLIVLDDWPRSDTALQVIRTRWGGLGQGHGMLATNELTVRSTDRRGQRSHTVRFCHGRLLAPTAHRLREPSR